MTEKPRLYEISMPDIYALCDAWAIDPEEHPDIPMTRLMTFVSIIAPITTVKAIRAHLSVRREPGAAYIMPYEDSSEDPHRQRKTAHLTLLKDPRTWQTRLPSLRRHHHLVLARRDPLPEANADDTADTFYCFARSEDGGAGSFYRTFTSRSPTPTIPQWAPYLWQHLLDTGAAKPLDTHGIHAWRCDIRYPEFEEHIRREVARGRLPVHFEDGAD